jgi:ADP-heptose:LPS heptosyltransferase
MIFESEGSLMFLKKIEQKGKKFLLWLLGFFLHREKLKPQDVDISNINKILVVRQDDRIGNLILTTPLLSALSRFFPQAQIWYLASKTFHTLFSESSLVDHILVARKRLYIFHPLALLFFIRRIRKQKFDLAIDASDENNFSLNNSFLVYLSGAKLRIGYTKPQSSLFLNLEVSPTGEKKHALEMHLDLLRHLVGDFQSNGLKIEVDKDKSKLVKGYLRERGIENGDLLVGMHIGGRGNKRWPIENFQNLADWMVDYLRAKVIFIWGPEERKIVQRISAKNKNQIISELLPLPVLSALIERCNLFVSPDTGAMHLSVAVGTPTLALFLDSDSVKFGPRGQSHQMLQAEEGKISVQRVKEVFQEMIKSNPAIRT